MKQFNRYALFPFIFLFATIFLIGCGSTSGIEKQNTSFGVLLDTVKAGRFDTGKMWTFDSPPVEYFQEAYGFRPTQEWLDNVRMSALRFANYCSASFVSAEGLIMTNHHCARQSVEQVSKEGENLVTNGFYAQTIAEERKVPGLYVDQLVRIEDATKEVQDAINQGKTDEERTTNRQTVITDIQKRESDKSGLRCSVVTLYNGGRYSLYYYKRYEDIRLVFAPEVALGFYGGDYDNFTYPRYDYDCSFFRIYQDSATHLKPEHYYKWSAEGAKNGDPVFIVGNPGRTTRLNTVAQLEYARDISYPLTVKMLKNRNDILLEEIKKHPDRKEQLQNQQFGISNSLKAITGYLDGLRDPILMQRKKDFEKKFHAAIEAKPILKAKYGAMWNNVAETRSIARSLSPELNTFQFASPMRSQLLGFASRVYEYTFQLSLSDDKRDLPNRGNGINSFKFRVKQMIPPQLDLELEKKYLAVQLEEALSVLGPNDQFIMLALKGKSPQQAAADLIDGTSLKDSTTRVKLLESSIDAMDQSTDPLIMLAREAAPRFRKAQATSRENQIREAANINLLGMALYEVYGNSIPPDATMTLRIADGVVKGYEYNGTIAPAITTFYGLYDRHYSFVGEESWALPERWLNYSKELDLSTPYNFVATCDIIGGNSGSPMINKNAEVVGVVFDGNMESLPGDFIFSEEKNRSVGLHSKGIIEAMKHIYHADRIVKELVQ